MQPLKRSPHYLVRNPHSFCFRVNVPKDLQRVVGRRELRYSLKTGYVGVARVKAQIIAAQVHQIFRCLRKGGRRLAELRKKRNHETVNNCLEKIGHACTNGINLMPAFIEAAENYVTLGEMIDELKQHFGIYEESVVF